MKPIYLKIEKYDEVLELVNEIKKKVGFAKKTLDDLNKIKSDEDAKISEWERNLEEAETKLNAFNEKIGL